MYRPLQRPAALLTWPTLLAAIALVVPAARAVLDITLQDTSSQIVYSPPVCGLTLSSAGTEICNSSWRVVPSPNASDGTLTITSGPNDATGDFIPQLFLSVRALALSIQTSPASTAIVNLSVSTSNPVTSITSQLNSSVQPISIIGLFEDRLTTLALTFHPSDRPTVLEIDAIVLTISDNNTAPFVPPPSPPSTVLPTVTPTISLPASSTALPRSHSQSSGDIAAEVLGALLGAVLLAALAAFAFIFYRKRRRRLALPEDPPPPPTS